MITVVGGIYYESCIHPKWAEVFGSAGRAASAIAKMNPTVTLVSYVDTVTREICRNRAALESFEFVGTEIAQASGFEYVHSLSTPYIRTTRSQHEPLVVKAENVLYFGMIEGEAIVDCNCAVYDPQNFQNPRYFHENGSKANHLAIILNGHEARVLTGQFQIRGENLVHKLIEQTGAEIVVLKQGPMGALLYHGSVFTVIPAFQTENVWKIGSGDVFVSHFSNCWMNRGMSPVESALEASKATAFYCNTRGLPDQATLESAIFETVQISDRVRGGYKPKIYLAGPFFTLAQQWQVEQARANLASMNLDVFSPLHDVGRGSAEQVVHRDLKGIEECDVVFAIGDGLDSGTVYEIGYARALAKPVVFYAENVSEENMKMMVGSACVIRIDYVSAIYRTVWEAISR
jgi:hypothetical protein